MNTPLLRLAASWLLSSACGTQSTLPVDVTADGGGMPHDAGTVEDAGHTPDASAALARHNVVFVTSTKHAPGALNGLMGADQICAERAAAAGLSGNFVAYLATRDSRPESRLEGSRGWVRRDGKPFVDTIEDIVLWHDLYPPNLDEFGDEVVGGPGRRPLPDGDWVITGQHETLETLELTCDDWTSMGRDGGEPQSAGWGFSNAGNHRWSRGGRGACDVPARLHCFETGKSEPLTIEETPGRIAFVSFFQFWSGTGRDPADAVCEEAAETAGLPGTFKALLADVDEPASERFSPGPPWVRLDGVVVATYEQLAQGSPITAPIIINADGTFHREFEEGAPVLAAGAMASGAPDTASPGTEATTCNGWTISDFNETTSAGHPYYAARAFFDREVLSGCGAPFNVYCLEE